MIEGMPGTPFEGEVRRRAGAVVERGDGFAVVDADRDGDEIVLVGTLAHLEERETGARDRAGRTAAGYGMQVEGGDGRAAGAFRRRRPHEVPRASHVRRHRHRGQAAQQLPRGRARGDRPRPPRDPPRGRDQARAPGRGRPLVERPAFDPGAAPAARAPRALLARAAPRPHYGADAHRVVRERPYELTSVFGVGLRDGRPHRPFDWGAGRLARARPGGVVHVLAEAERGGSTCLPVPELARRAGAVLGAASPSAALLHAMAEADELVLETDGEAIWAYRPPTAALEAELARRVRELAGTNPRLPAPRGVPAGTLLPAPEQDGAVRAAFASRLVDRDRRSGHGQDGDDPADLRRRRRGAQARDRARRPDRPGRPADGRGDRPGRLDDPLRARLGSRPGTDGRGARGRPPGRGRDLDGQPRSARHAAARRRAADARRARRGRRPARARGRRATLRGARGERSRCPSPGSPTCSARRPGA